MGNQKIKVGAVRVPGPLAQYAGEFESRLTERGYAPKTRVTHLRLMSHLSRWLEESELGLEDLSRERLEQYLALRRARGYSSLCSRQGVSPLLGTLTCLGLLPQEQAVTAPSRIDLLLDGFRGYLRDERGLTECTAQTYLLRVGRFVADYGHDGDLRGLTSAQVSAAVLQESGSLSVGSVQLFVTALRSLLRYCQVAGLVDKDLSGAALGITGRRRSCLPQRVSASEVTALLRSCDRRTALGRRDYAVVLTLARLGLRAGELAGLRLEDLDWRAGLLLVHGKGNCVEQLPIPDDVGTAITAYLRRARPRTDSREVFLTARAPRTGLARSGVSYIVRRACVRAGLAPFGPHRLRHSLACQMVRAGVPLPEIGQVLRHKAMASTAIYARVDVDQLRTVAQPWPDEAHR